MGYTLRVSVIDICQLRCKYCLPHGAKGLPSFQSPLTIAHYERFARVIKALPIDKIRLTGGEPLLRKDLPEIVGVFSALDLPLALTTNGLGFVAMKDRLVSSGLRAVTFHLDTLIKARYREFMGHGSVRRVLAAIDEAKALALLVKINVVVQRGLNDDELENFLRFSKKIDVEIRFIEQMNTGSAKAHVAKTFMSGSEILNRIDRFTKIAQLPRNSPHDPAERFFAIDLGISFGLIASDTRPFCHNCNRLRLSANGRIRTCLYEPIGQDIGLVDLSLSDIQVLARFRQIISKKQSFHPALNQSPLDFSMAQVGG